MHDYLSAGLNAFSLLRKGMLLLLQYLEGWPILPFLPQPCKKRSFGRILLLVLNDAKDLVVTSAWLASPAMPYPYPEDEALSLACLLEQQGRWQKPDTLSFRRGGGCNLNGLPSQL